MSSLDPKPDDANLRGEASEVEVVQDHVAHNIETMVALHAEAEDRVSRTQKQVEHFTAVIGRPRSLKIVLGAVVVWVSYNAIAPWVGMPQPDPPPCQWLQGVI